MSAVYILLSILNGGFFADYLTLDISITLVVVLWLFRLLFFNHQINQIFKLLANIEVVWRNKIFASFLRRDALQTQKLRSGDLLNVLVTESRLALDGLYAAADLFHSVITLFFIFLTVVVFAPLGLIPIAVIICTLITYVALRGKTISAAGTMHSTSNVQYANQISETTKSIIEIKLLDLIDKVSQRNRHLNETSSFNFAFVNYTAHEIRNVIEFAILLSVFATAYYVNTTTHNDFIVAQVTYLIVVAYRSLPYSSRLGIALTKIRSRTNEFDSIHKRLVALSDYHENPHQPAILDWRTLTVKFGKLQLEENTLFENAQILIHKNKINILHGPSGHGKTSILSAITMLYGFENSHVEYMLDGKSMESDKETAWQRSLSYVTQEPYIFHDTLRNNLFPGEDFCPVKFRQISALTGFDDVVNALPQGIETIVGENGAGLSGGQKKKLAISRALILEKDIVILDEPTGGFDSKSEDKFVRLVRDLKESGHTLVISTHNQKVIDMAEVSYFVKDGNIDLM
jgi:ABC-type multidrug transport system fused ATPase/permease subunit